MHPRLGLTHPTFRKKNSNKDLVSDFYGACACVCVCVRARVRACGNQRGGITVCYRNNCMNQRKVQNCVNIFKVERATLLTIPVLAGYLL
jgi:hypothetical protein